MTPNPVTPDWRRATQIADFLGALILVYTLIIFASIIVSWVFSFGVRVPYSRPLNAVLDFLRDVTNPYLRIFRRLGLQFGPIDFSPIVAILVLLIGGRLHRGPDPPRMSARRTVLRTALVAVAVVVADQVTKAIVRARDLALRGGRPRPRDQARSTPATRAWPSACSRAAGRWS